MCERGFLDVRMVGVVTFLRHPSPGVLQGNRRKTAGRRDAAQTNRNFMGKWTREFEGCWNWMAYCLFYHVCAALA